MSKSDDTETNLLFTSGLSELIKIREQQKYSKDNAAPRRPFRDRTTLYYPFRLRLHRIYNHGVYNNDAYNHLP
jgi:hypothetical protein